MRLALADILVPSLPILVLLAGCGASTLDDSGAPGGAPAYDDGSSAGGITGSGGAIGSASGGSANAGASSGGTSSGGATDGGSTAAGGASSGGSGDGATGGTSATGGASATGGTTGSTLDASAAPGENFDLSHWILQLPVASGDSVKQISDLSTYESDYFYTGSDGAMVFWCPVTGAHTPNTHYPRSELREKASGGDWAISGSHVMEVTFRVTKNVASKGVIIGQIHGNATGGTAEVLKLEWMSDNSLVASVEDNNDPATQINKTIGKYSLGQRLTYRIALVDKQLTVTITDADGNAKSVTSPYTASSWASDKYYFKLGSYVQLNTGTSADGARVAIYSVKVKHG